MQTLINWSKFPVVVADENGDRVTIKPGGSKTLPGDFKNHPWVKKGRLEIVKPKGVEFDGDDELPDDSDDLQVLREQYKSIFGKSPHGNASAEKIRQEIEKWREAQD